MTDKKQLRSFIDETRRGVPVGKIPYKPTDFIPFVGLVTRQLRVDKAKSPLEEVIERHGNPVIPDYLEYSVGRYMNSLVWDWRAKHMKKNLSWKFYLYHVGTSAIPLLYGLISYL